MPSNDHYECVPLAITEEVCVQIEYGEVKTLKVRLKPDSPLSGEPGLPRTSRKEGSLWTSSRASSIVSSIPVFVAITVGMCFQVAQIHAQVADARNILYVIIVLHRYDLNIYFVPNVERNYISLVPAPFVVKN